jgi:hypothetical protein
VVIVDAAFGRPLAELVDHVADVVEQHRDDQRIALTIGIRERGTLQRMVELRDVVQPIAAHGLLGIERVEVVPGGVHRRLSSRREARPQTTSRPSR